MPMLFPGSGVVLQHFRKNEECDVLEELPPIETNLKYDFNYQVYQLLQVTLDYGMHSMLWTDKLNKVIKWCDCLTDETFST